MDRLENAMFRRSDRSDDKRTNLSKLNILPTAGQGYAIMPTKVE